MFGKRLIIDKPFGGAYNHSNDIKKILKGLIIESYIEDGAQKPEECVYGKSITDPCLGWEKTEKLIYDLAEEW